MKMGTSRRRIVDMYGFPKRNTMNKTKSTATVLTPTTTTTPTTPTTSIKKRIPTSNDDYDSAVAFKATTAKTTTASTAGHNNNIKATTSRSSSKKQAARSCTTPESHISVLQVNEHFETMWKNAAVRSSAKPESPSSVLLLHGKNEHFNEKKMCTTTTKEEKSMMMKDPNGLPCLDQRVLELLESGINLQPHEVVFTTKPDQFDQVHPIETPELVAYKIQEFDKLLAKISLQEKKEAADAERLCPELLTPQFKLLFLRTECFRIKDTVKRWIIYWERRIKLFGKVAGYKPLTIKNCLKEEDMKYFAQNHFHSFKSGDDDRTCNIIYLNRTKPESESLITMESALRCSWYTHHVDLFENITLQKKGLIMIQDLKGIKPGSFDSRLIMQLSQNMMGALPIRLSGYFFLHSPRFSSMLITVGLNVMPSRIRKRFTILSGNDEKKIIKSFEKFGIKQNDLPYELGGGNNMIVNSLDWYNKRRKIEEEGL